MRDTTDKREQLIKVIRDCLPFHTFDCSEDILQKLEEKYEIKEKDNGAT